MKGIIILLSVVTLCLSFALIIIGFNYYNVKFTLSGVIKYQAEAHISVSAAAPEGYCIESPVFGLVYVSHNEIDKYRGKQVRLYGGIRTISNKRDGYPVYPLIQADWIQEIK